MKDKWISVIREDFKEKRFRADRIFDMRLGLNDILICLADMGWKHMIYFSLATSEVRNAKEGDHWDWEIVTKEELEKLRIELEAITKKS